MSHSAGGAARSARSAWVDRSGPDLIDQRRWKVHATRRADPPTPTSPPHNATTAIPTLQMALSRAAMKTLARSAGASTPSMSVAARSQHTMANDKYMQTPEHYQVSPGGGTPVGKPNERATLADLAARRGATRSFARPLGEP